MAGFRVSNLNGVIRSLTMHVTKSERIAVLALADVAFAVEREAKLRAAEGGTHKRNEPTGATPGSGPARVTGALQRSIRTDIRSGLGSYTATIYPTMVYAKTVEQGSPLWGKRNPDKQGNKYPFLIPAGQNVAPRANKIFTDSFKRRSGL